MECQKKKKINKGGGSWREAGTGLGGAYGTSPL